MRPCIGLPLLLLLAHVLLHPAPCTARIHHLAVANDDRAAFSIQRFGFRPGGRVELRVTGFSVQGVREDEDVRAGIVLRAIPNDQAASLDVKQTEAAEGRGECILHDSHSRFVVDLSNRSTWEQPQVLAETMTQDSAAMYDVLFARCQPADRAVSFRLDLTMYNPGPDYLSAGESALPALYLASFLAFAAALGAWVWFMLQHKGQVHRIHLVMAALLLVKCMSLLFHSTMYHYIQRHGVPAVGWNTAYYVFASLKGVMMFTAIVLVGTGWSLVKPFLSVTEKRLLVLVLSLQVLDNVAMVVAEDAAPAAAALETWIRVLRFVDILCCCAVLFPIVWSIRSLRQAAATDGKASLNMLKLMQFRHFYVLVVCYIYFTRIFLVLLQAALPYHFSWLPELLSELATLGFFVTTGWKFRPTSNNPYLQLAAADDSPPEDEDYGLDSGSDHELPGGARARRGAAGEGGAEDKALELPEKP